MLKIIRKFVVRLNTAMTMNADELLFIELSKLN